jgi:hypothetical protein
MHVAFARKLFKLGSSSDQDPILCYVLLQLASERAAQAGKVSLAVEIIDRVAEEFEVDALRMKLGALTDVVHSFRGLRQLPPAAEEVGPFAISFIEEAVGLDEYDAANECIELAGLVLLARSK